MESLAALDSKLKRTSQRKSEFGAIKSGNEDSLIKIEGSGALNEGRWDRA